MEAPPPDFDPQAFLKNLRIESLADREVMDHEGNMVPLQDALVSCAAARSSIEAAVDMARDFAGEDADVTPVVSKYFDKMAADAKKKVAEPELESIHKQEVIQKTAAPDKVIKVIEKLEKNPPAFRDTRVAAEVLQQLSREREVRETEDRKPATETHKKQKPVIKEIEQPKHTSKKPERKISIPTPKRQEVDQSIIKIDWPPQPIAQLTNQEHSRASIIIERKPTVAEQGVQTVLPPDLRELPITLSLEPQTVVETEAEPPVETVLYDARIAEVSMLVELTNKQLEENFSYMLDLAIAEARAEIFDDQLNLVEVMPSWDGMELVESEYEYVDQTELELMPEQILPEVVVNEAQTEIFAEQFDVAEATFGMTKAADKIESIEQPLLELVPEQSRAVIHVLPETIKIKLIDYVETAEPKMVMMLETQLEFVAATADRLHELSITDSLDTPEVVQIEALIIEWCEQLCQLLKIDMEEDQIKQFVEQIKVEQIKLVEYGEQVGEAIIAREDEGTRERKLGIFSMPQQLSVTQQHLQTRMGQLMIKLVAVTGLEPVTPSL